MNLFGPAFKLDPLARRKAVRAALALAGLVVAIVWHSLYKWSHGSLPGEDPRSDLQLLAGLFLMRFAAVLALVSLATGATVLVFRILERTRLGHQLFKWREEDPVLVPAARTLGMAIMAGSVFLGITCLFAGIIR